MTSPNIDSDRLSILFDLACETAEASPGDLTLAEQQELARLRALLDSIDAAWQAPQTRVDHVQALFLQKLALESPEHPWVRLSTVQTLGQLLRLSAENAPALPPDTVEHLLADDTPVETLLDPQGRKPAIREVVRRAGVPQTTIGELLLWINRAIALLVPQANAGTTRLLFTRSQGESDGLHQTKTYGGKL